MRNYGKGLRESLERPKTSTTTINPKAIWQSSKTPAAEGDEETGLISMSDKDAGRATID
jgi:hypothetical protein